MIAPAAARVSSQAARRSSDFGEGKHAGPKARREGEPAKAGPASSTGGSFGDGGSEGGRRSGTEGPGGRPLPRGPRRLRLSDGGRDGTGAAERGGRGAVVLFVHHVGGDPAAKLPGGAEPLIADRGRGVGVSRVHRSRGRRRGAGGGRCRSRPRGGGGVRPVRRSRVPALGSAPRWRRRGL